MPQNSALSSTSEKLWTDLVSTEGRFSVLFPKQPKKTFSKNQFVQMHTFEALVRKSRFAASYFDAPVPLDNPEVKEQIFELGKKHHSAGRLIESKNIFLGEYLGKEYRYALNAPRGAQYVVKVYLVGQRVYQLDYYTPAKNSDLSEANKFFDSFKLITPIP